MKFDWQQLSPREREALLRHFLLKRKNVPVTAEKVCAALHATHYLSCYSNPDGKAIFRFVHTAKGARSGASVAENLTDGIFKAALRTKGIQVEDGFGGWVPPQSRRVSARAGR